MLQQQYVHNRTGLHRYGHLRTVKSTRCFFGLTLSELCIHFAVVADDYKLRLTEVNTVTFMYLSMLVPSTCLNQSCFQKKEKALLQSARREEGLPRYLALSAFGLGHQITGRTMAAHSVLHFLNDQEALVSGPAGWLPGARSALTGSGPS